MPKPGPHPVHTESRGIGVTLEWTKRGLNRTRRVGGTWDIPTHCFFHSVGMGAPTVCRPSAEYLEEEREPSFKELLVQQLRRGADSEESPCNAGDPGLIPGKIPWRRKWQPTAVFLPGESHGQKRLAVCSKWGCKESDMTK